MLSQTQPLYPPLAFGSGGKRSTCQSKYPGACYRLQPLISARPSAHLAHGSSIDVLSIGAIGAGQHHDWAITGARIPEKLAAQGFLTTVVEQDNNSTSARVTGLMINILPVGDSKVPRHCGSRQPAAMNDGATAPGIPRGECCGSLLSSDIPIAA